MIVKLFKSSISWRLHAIILSIVLVMSTLCAYIFTYKTKDNRLYERLISNLSLVNNTPKKVIDVVGDIMLYQKSPSPELETRIFTAIDRLIVSIENVQDYTDTKHEDSVNTAHGIRQIIGNLQQISRETVDEINKGARTILLYENIDLLNILIEVVQKNVTRYVSSELVYAIELKNTISQKNTALGVLLTFFIFLNLIFVLILVSIVRKSIVRPIQNLEKHMSRFQEKGIFSELDITAEDEIGSLTKAFNEMTKEVKVREQSLQESEEKYRLLADNANDIIFVLDINLNYIYVSPSIRTLLGYDPGAVLGQPASVTLTPDSWDLVKKSFPDNLKSRNYSSHDNQNYKTLELEMVRMDNTVTWTEITFSLISKENDSFPNILGVARNINDRIIAERKRAQLQAQLAQAQKMESVGRLAGGVAHDFNNMLSIILGNCEVALEDLGESHPTTPSLYEIYNAAERSTILTRQLLAFARRQTITPKVINLNQTVENMLSMIQRLIGEDIALTWLPKNNLWNVKIDPSQVDQIIANLCVNARDAIKDIGKVSIETGNVQFDESYCRTHRGFRLGNYVMISVSDNGCGMEKETLAHIFEPFFTTKETGKGTGLGLATVYGIATQNKGLVHVYSEPGEGTIFKVYLPKHGEMLGSEPQPKLEKVTQKGDETILLVEDEQGILKLTKKMLKRMGYNVLAAHTPGEAIKISDESIPGQIHLLMTDVVMPEMNGLDLANTLQKSDPKLKCLFMSGYTYNVIAHHGILDEGLNFINKPFSMQELSAKLREILGESSLDEM